MPKNKLLIERKPNARIRVVIDVDPEGVVRIAIRERQGDDWIPVERSYRAADIAMLRTASGAMKSLASGVTDFDDVIARLKKKSKRMPIKGKVKKSNF